MKESNAKDKTSYVSKRKMLILVAAIVLATIGTLMILENENTEQEQPSLIGLLLQNSYISFGNNTNTIIVEFTDLACPFSARFWINTFPKIKENYIDTGKVLYIVRDYPIPQLHGLNPFYASQYARCVVKISGNTDLYNVIANKLYSDRKSWVRADYSNLSHYLLNLVPLPENIHNKVVDCYYYNDTAYDVYLDYQTALSLQILGTPAFFLLVKEDLLTDEEIKEIKDKLALYGLNITVIKQEWAGENYYIIHFLGALPYEAFDYILQRATS